MAASMSSEELAVLQAENKSPMFIALVVVFTVIGFVCVALRLVTRFYLTRNAGWEDYFITLSMCFSIAMAVCQIEQARAGTGRHAMFLSLNQGIMILKYTFFSILAYCVSLTLTKVSILLQYRRIFTLKEDRKPIYIVIGICVLYGVETVLTGTFTCIPVYAFWDLLRKPTAKCLNENALYYANGGLNIATDLVIAALPVKAIWNLQMATKQKIALQVILTVGWFVCVVSVIRLSALIALARHSDDASWYGAATGYWSAIEVNLAIVCASTPALKPLIVRVIPEFASRLGSGHTSSKSRKGSSKGSSRDRKSFIELKGKSSSSTITRGDDVELGESNLTALPAAGSTHAHTFNIHVTKDFEQHFENIERDSEIGNQTDLVVDKFPRASLRGNGRANH